MGLALLLAGCGYHLRGTQGVTAALPPLHLGGDRSIPLYEILRRALEETGTPLVARESAQLVLVLLGEQRDRRVLSVAATGTEVQEYELIYSATFEAYDAAGRPLLTPQTVRRTRDIRFDKTAVNTLVSESEQLYRDMRLAAGREILRRLQAAAQGLEAAGGTPGEKVGEKAGAP